MEVDPVGDSAHFGGFVIPSLSFVGVLGGECLKGVEYGGIAFLYVVVGALQPFFNLGEAVEHIARHVQSKHGGEDDIH